MSTATKKTPVPFEQQHPAEVVDVRFVEAAEGDLVQANWDLFGEDENGLRVQTTETGGLGRVLMVAQEEDVAEDANGNPLLNEDGEPYLAPTGRTIAFVKWEQSGRSCSCIAGEDFGVLCAAGFAEDDASTPEAPAREFVTRGKR